MDVMQLRRNLLMQKVVNINQWDEQWEIGAINPYGGADDDSDTGCFRSKGFIPVTPNTTYYIYKDTDKYSRNIRFIRYRSNKEFIDAPGSLSNANITTSSETYYLRFYIRTQNSGVSEGYVGGISVNYPSTDHDYHRHI